MLLIDTDRSQKSEVVVSYDLKNIYFWNKNKIVLEGTSKISDPNWIHVPN